MCPRAFVTSFWQLFLNNKKCCKDYNEKRLEHFLLRLHGVIKGSYVGIIGHSSLIEVNQTKTTVLENDSELI